MNYVIFDDVKWENFFPLTLNRSTGDLRLGILKLRQRICAYLEVEIKNIIVHQLLRSLYKERHPDWTVNYLEAQETIFINSRLKISDALVKAIHSLDENSCLVYKNEILAARLIPPAGAVSTEKLPTLFKGLDREKWESDATWKFLWELISQNSKYIERDFHDFFYDKDNFFEAEQGVTILNPYNIWLGEGTKIAPGVVLDAAHGPIIIDENAGIMANAVLLGPVYVGKSSVVKIGARLYPGTSIGPFCKIGGEVEQSIFQAYSDKQQEGYMGNSYLGEWIKLGAHSSINNLQSNLARVEMYFYPKSHKTITECRHLGAVIGDHTVTGINCAFCAGTSVGIGCRLLDGELAAGFIPSYKVNDDSADTEYEFADFCASAAIAKAEKKIGFSKSEKELYSNIHKSVLNTDCDFLCRSNKMEIK